MIDSNNSGSIDYSEFISFTNEQQKLLSVENLKKTFKKLDLDNNGTLSIDELKKAFDGGILKRKEKFWKSLMSSIDSNQDNKIQLEEFIKFMEKLQDNEDEDRLEDEILLPSTVDENGYVVV